MKKLFCILLAAFICISCVTSAFAEFDAAALQERVEQLETEMHERDVKIAELEAVVASLQSQLEDFLLSQGYTPKQELKGPTQTVELSPSNFYDFFEIVVVPQLDPFGGLKRIDAKIVPLEEYLDKIDYSSEFSFDVLSYAEGKAGFVALNEDGSLSYSSPDLSMGEVTANGAITITNADLKAIVDYVFHDGEFVREGSVWATGIFESNGFNCEMYGPVEIRNVQGNIVLFE